MVDAEARYRELLGEIRAEFPRFRLIRKDRSAFQRAIDRALRLVTAGRMTAYLNGYQTTIGYRVYVTPDWDSRPATQRYITMRHERVHLRQFRRYTLPAMALLYLLVPVPTGLAWFRAHFERQAYEETLRATLEVHGPEALRDPALRRGIVAQFTGPSYGWMWPFRRSVERWYDRAVERLIA